MIESIELKKPISPEAVERVERWWARNGTRRSYPEQRLLRCELYPKHTAFFASAKHRERLMMAANQWARPKG